MESFLDKQTIKIVRWIVAIFCLMLASALWADYPKSIYDYQGVWARDDASQNTLSKVIIINPHVDWIIKIYQHCQESGDCLIAQIPIQADTDVSGKVDRMTAFWQKKFPQSTHVILLYQLVLTPQDSHHLGWKIFVRDESKPTQLLTTMQGALSRDELPQVQSVVPPAQQDASKDVAKVELCRKLNVDCVLVKDPSALVGSFSVDQQKVDDNGVSRCLPLPLKNYDAQNISLLFKLDNNECFQKWPVKCANLQCTAIIKDFKSLGKVLGMQESLIDSFV